MNTKTNINANTETASTTPEAPETPVTPPVPTPQAPAEAAEHPEAPEAPEAPEGKAGRDAAKYRRQLRDTEAERDQLSASVETLRKQIVAGNMPHGSSAGAELLWTSGCNPADLFDEAGALDPDKLTTAVQDVHKRVGLHFGPSPVHASGTGHYTGTDGPTWSDALKRK
ncbi:hypothetical protein [Arthrobacter sp. A5]|uniref:hypothetical protein n=1 Tax=Arthrobacter sp. A5 TaxID=576926 RepID=UPI003DA9A318